MSAPFTSRDAANRLSRRQALLFGGLFFAIGLVPILIAAGLIGHRETAESPPWVIACVGATFALGGLAVILEYAIAPGVDASGNLDPSTPFALQVAQLVLVLGIVGAMTAAFGWVAFGPGERQFSATVAIPGLAVRAPSGARSGRIAFGIMTILMGCALAAIGVSGARRLARIHGEGAAKKP